MSRSVEGESRIAVLSELVVTGLKNGVFMLRGGASGDGKLRTMEISLAIRDWGLLWPMIRYSMSPPAGALRK